jgi:hypothetical protein
LQAAGIGQAQIKGVGEGFGIHAAIVPMRQARRI